MDGQRKIDDLDRVGGHPAIDFVNTVNGWQGAEPGAEYLTDYAALVRWHQLAGLIGPRGTKALTASSEGAQRAAVRDAVAFRGALHALFQAVARDDELPQPALDALNAMIRETAPWRRLTAQGRAISCGWDFDGAPPRAILGPVAWQAAELLEHGALDRMKECPDGPGCGWLFIDTSKNRSRTWCSMKTCGTANKVRRFRARNA